MPALKIIHASAGSGKTFSLALQYIKLLLKHPDNYRHILAVTFTNKATEEMKSRIINELFLLSSGKDSLLLNNLITETGLSGKDIRHLAGKALTGLLHHYSWFSVSTIDSFFQKIIRSFTKELGIGTTYSIELDTDLILDNIISALYKKSENDKSLFTWLTRFAESLIDQGDNWNFRNEITNLGMEIFKENYKAIASSDRYSNREQIREFQSILRNIYSKTLITYSSYGKKAMHMLSKFQLTVDDFSYKARGPAGFLFKLSVNEFKEPTDTVIKAAESADKWFAANAFNKDLIKQVAESELMPLLSQAIDYYTEHHKQFYTAGVILQNLYSLGIISDMSLLVDEWCRENDTFLLPEAPVFINKIIDDSDTPFIYEKSGYLYHHYMIDEFQDTSLMQWSNFRPLISNSLSQDYESLVVGDIKQSVYRWRNSDWKVLDENIYNDFPSQVISELSLLTNWRSGSNIIEFNNLFFTKAAEILDDHLGKVIQSDNGSGNIYNDIQPVRHIYEHIKQKPGNVNKHEGYVRVDFIDSGNETDYHETVMNNLTSLIRELQDKGIQLNDIAILTRTNNEAKKIAEHFLQHNKKNPDTENILRVISDEALMLSSSTITSFIISLLKYISSPFDKNNAYILAAFYQNYLHGEKDQKQWIDPLIQADDLQKVISSILPEEYLRLSDSSNRIALIELVEQLILIFRLEENKGEIAYLNAFRDIVLDFSKKAGSDISEFLIYWDQSGKNKTISAPSQQNALRILTIHKSKGLEFQNVIIPFCSWGLNSTKNKVIWCRSTIEPFNLLDTVPLNYSSGLKKTHYAKDYYVEYQKQLIDNLNLLYVAFTRAQSGLFIFSKNSDGNQIMTISNLIANVIGAEFYSKGTVTGMKRNTANNNNEVYIPSNVSLPVLSERFKITYPGSAFVDPISELPFNPLNEGKLLHEAFTMISVSEDVEKAVDHLYGQGKISDTDRKRYFKLIQKAITNKKVSDWFTGKWLLLNETEIIMPDGTIKRPDRVMIKDNHAVIVEYKFGRQVENYYNSQLKGYINIIRQMGYGHVEGYLWYVMLNNVQKM